jgi:hypothetical protein
MKKWLLFEIGHAKFVAKKPRKCALIMMAPRKFSMGVIAEFFVSNAMCV